MDPILNALKEAQDTDAIKEHFKDLAALLKARKAAGQSMDKLPQGVVKIVGNQMSSNVGSSDLVFLGLSCLTLIMATPNKAGLLLRLEGGVKTLGQVLKRHPERTKVATPALKLVLRGCSNSPQTLLAFLKEKGFVPALLESFKAHIHDAVTVSICLELAVLFTRYEKGARLLCGTVFVETCSQVMLSYVGQWDLFGYVLKSLKNIAKYEEPRITLLRDTQAREVLLSTSRVVARVHDRPKLLKRAYRALWMMSSATVLSCSPEQEAEVAVAEEDVNADLPSAMDCVYERDCHLFPELLEPSAPAADDDLVGCMDEEGHVPIFPVREMGNVTEPHISAEQYSVSSRPYSSQGEKFHTGGASLVAEMMVHDLQRIVNKKDIKNTLVYDNLVGNVGPAAAASGGGAPDCLTFESRFETANLRAAARVYDHEYDLWLSTDINETEDPGHRQWFFFSLANAKPGVKYKFNLVNLVKKDSLCNTGMSPLVARGLNEAAMAKKRDFRVEPDISAVPATMQWRRVMERCCYYPSPYRSTPICKNSSSKSAKGRKALGSSGKTGSSKSNSSSGSLSKLSNNDAAAPSAPATTDLVPTAQLVGRGLFCLTFSHTFESPGTYYIAMCFPYSYTDLQEHLSRVCLSFRDSPGYSVSRVARRSLLCRTLSKHRCDLVTITDFGSEDSEPGSREYVVISSRVHPGETNSSWVMKGVIDFLTSQHPTARSMRQSFIFKVIPCLNPDGVINGNYRCGLAGVDLNRVWDKPDKTLHPTIWHTRALVQRLASTGRLALFCDLHGHSRREDAFFYGCDPPAPVASNSAAAAESKAPVLGAEARREEAERIESELDAGAAKALTPKDVARLRVRMLPYLMAKIDEGVSFSKCSFKVARSKMSTGRVVVCRQLRVAGSYTLETSLGGCSKTGAHFGGADLMRLGKSLCEAIAELADADEEQLLDEMAADIELGGRK